MTNKREGELQPGENQVLGFLGLGLDNTDGEQRFTRSEHFFLIGGSEDTHARMQDTAIHFTEGLKRRGQRLEEATLEEIVALFHESCQ